MIIVSWPPARAVLVVPPAEQADAANAVARVVAAIHRE
jgi:hypothetical protein